MVELQKKQQDLTKSLISTIEARFIMLSNALKEHKKELKEEASGNDNEYPIIFYEEEETFKVR